MAVQAALGSDIALAFDECTPYHADRDYTARSTERTHRWLERCLAWHDEHGPRRQARVRDRPGRRPRGPAPRVGGGGRGRRRRRARDRRHARPRQAGDARRARDDGARCCPPRRPSTCSGSASPTTCWTGSGSGSTSSTAPCPPASPATGWRWRRCPTRAFASTSPGRGTPRTTGPLVDGCPCPTCAVHSRAYLHYLARAEAPTAARLLTLHNLTFLERLVAGARRRSRRSASAPTGRSSSGARPHGRPRS